MGVVRLVLVRHGQSQWNAAGILQGHGGPGLTDRGHAQARATAHVLARDHAGAVAIARSDLPRVVETAAPTEQQLAGVEVRVDERLREIDVGSWSGLTRAQAAAADPERYAAWAGGADVAPGGGETFAALRQRVVAALTDVVAEAGGRGGAQPDRGAQAGGAQPDRGAQAGGAQPDRGAQAGGAQPATVLVFTHGGPIRVAVAAALGLPVGGHRSVTPVGNCAVSVLDVPTPTDLAHGGALLAAYNRVGHLGVRPPG